MKLTEPSDPRDAAVDFATLLAEELTEIAALRKKRRQPREGSIEVPASLSAPAKPSPGEKPKEAEARADRRERDEQEHALKVFAAAHKADLVGLAFSGGGIRSATFNLGVLQGLAKLRLLPMFDYLSTVSGGGYIGSWFEAWIYRAGQNSHVAEVDPRAGLGPSPAPLLRVQESINPDRSTKPGQGESNAIRFLREYSNYLTPRLGFLGADTWTAVAIYLRNLLLNQAILILFLSFVLLLPHVAVGLSARVMRISEPCPEVAFVVLAVLLIVALTSVSWNMTHLEGRGPTGEFPPSARQGFVLASVALPSFIAAWLIALWTWRGMAWLWPLWMWIGLGILGFGVTWVIAAVIGFRRPQGHSVPWNSGIVVFKCSLYALASGTVAGLLLWVFAKDVIKPWVFSDGTLWYVVSFGTPLVVGIFLLVAALQLGLMGILYPDPRREWWGRLGGWLLILSVAWAAAFALSVYSPLAVLWATRRWTLSAAALWILNTATGVLGGNSSKTGSQNTAKWTDKALSLTPYLFIVGLAAGLATLLEFTLAKLNGLSLHSLLARSPAASHLAEWAVSISWAGSHGQTLHQQGTVDTAAAAAAATNEVFNAHWIILGQALNWRLAWPVLGALILCVILARRVNLNEFSMNLFYRNRLVRCYLGASHKFRNPNPFTGFDPADDLNLSKLTAANCYSGPFPIFNTALNLVKGNNLAWQERKAESFVLTPLRCGFDTWLERLDLKDESMRTEGRGLEKYGFRPTTNYAYSAKVGYPGGFRLGTAASISGAAASPNMGYHSTPSLAFLLTFFNVRLGFWAGNPRHHATWMEPGPRFGLFQLIAELFGLTDDEAKYVYLSDGGHFENLGLYELVKRRCKYIIVCDADADGSYAFGDVGNAIRKCREDLGVEISLTTDQLAPQTTGEDAGFSQWHWAVGTIDYSLVDPHQTGPGIIAYLKTSLTGDESADVLNYHRVHPDFPHQTTAEQWFTESQFESYRCLGQHTITELLENIQVAGRTADQIFGDLATQWNRV
jgi:Patatin-like phospholipase